MGKYYEKFQKSVKDPVAFWGKAAEAIDWYRKWDKVIDGSNRPFYRWFAGGEWAEKKSGSDPRGYRINSTPDETNLRVSSLQVLRSSLLSGDGC